MYSNKFEVNGYSEMTALHFACDTNNLDVVKAVASIGCYVETKDGWGKLPDDRTKNNEIKKYLKELIIEKALVSVKFSSYILWISIFRYFQRYV